MASHFTKQASSGGSGQSINDRITSFKHSMSGSLVAKSICKATTEEISAPKRKHLDFLVQLTFQNRLSISDFSKYLLDRLRDKNWVVVLKGLITVHHLMHYGSDQFSQFLATNETQLSSAKFAERTHNNTINSYIRTYASYLRARANSIATVGFDFCKLKRGNSETNLRKLPLAKLSHVLPLLANLLQALSNFTVTENDIIGNPIMRSAHLLLYVDMIRLYAVYNEGMINLIGQYFNLSRRECTEALKMYKTYLQRMEDMSAFVNVAEKVTQQSIDLDSSDSVIFRKRFDSISPVPPSVLEALEAHLLNLDDRKNLKALPAPAEMVSAPKPAAIAASQFNISDELMRNILDDERKRLDSFVKNAHNHVESQERDMLTVGKELQEEDFFNLGKLAATESGANSWAMTPTEVARTTAKPAQPPSQDLLLLDFLSDGPSTTHTPTTTSGSNGVNPFTVLNGSKDNPFFSDAGFFEAEAKPVQDAGAFWGSGNAPAAAPGGGQLIAPVPVRPACTVDEKIAELANMTLFTPPTSAVPIASPPHTSTTVNWATGAPMFAGQNQFPLNVPPVSATNPWTMSTADNPASMYNMNSAMQPQFQPAISSNNPFAIPSAAPVNNVAPMNGNFMFASSNTSQKNPFL